MVTLVTLTRAIRQVTAHWLVSRQRGPAEGIAQATTRKGAIAFPGAALVLFLCYLLCRMVLDRHRLARWESAWVTVGPRWTTRR